MEIYNLKVNIQIEINILKEKNIYLRGIQYMKENIEMELKMEKEYIMMYLKT